MSMHDRTLGLTRPPAATALSILLNKGCTHTTKTHALSVPSTGTHVHMPSQELIQSKDAEISAVMAISIYSDLLRSIWVGNGHEPHQWGDFQGPNCSSGT